MKFVATLLMLGIVASVTTGCCATMQTQANRNCPPLLPQLPPADPETGIVILTTPDIINLLNYFDEVDACS